ncbi:hypothetical protein [Dinghuibacter silviterrae]|uniref:Uncharacterized protein n=1 Tax=Dinghuibacter silviterrae TaxID=1539049 RepID=A0A4R8DQP7_9BACT|nr:hypothetical protein [Dinghuibacter silviterrae]TDX00118.1 hypothetical protein EDB95_1135 [Dinghuibacter silviterrae]
MKKCLLSLLLLTVIRLAPAMAQVPPQEDPAVRQARLQRIESLKITFIAQRLNLTQAEANQFWPLYYQYQKELHGVVTNKGLDELTRQEAMVDVRKRYLPQFTGVIGLNRSKYVFQSEHDFNQLLIQQHFQRINPGARPGLRRGF